MVKITLSAVFSTRTLKSTLSVLTALPIDTSVVAVRPVIRLCARASCRSANRLSTTRTILSLERRPDEPV